MLTLLLLGSAVVIYFWGILSLYLWFVFSLLGDSLAYGIASFSGDFHMWWYVYHYIRIILCDWVPGRYSVNLRTCAGHNAFVLHQSLPRVGLYFLNMPFSCPPLDVVLYQVLRFSEQESVILWSYQQRRYKTFCVCYYPSVLCRCALVLCGLRVWFKDQNIEIFNLLVCEQTRSP